ncbi:MAG: DUF2975 domain-containing protein [Bacteroidales bacterium]|nr:DUF2975 domain-containing protein [Bacteroidales bacterium]
MEQSRLLRFSSRLFNIFFGMSILVSSVLAVLLLAGLFYPPLVRNLFEIVLPIKLTGIPVTLTNGEIIKLTIENVSSHLDLSINLPLITYLHIVSFVIMLFVGTYFLYVICILVDGARENNPFTFKLFTHLKRVAIFYLSSNLFLWARDVFVQGYFLEYIEEESLRLSNSEIWINYNFLELLSSFVTPLILIVIAEILRQGAKLKEEQESFI